VTRLISRVFAKVFAFLGTSGGRWPVAATVPRALAPALALALVLALSAGASDRVATPASVSIPLPADVDPNDVPPPGGRGLDQLFEGARKERERLAERERLLASPAFRGKREASKAEFVGVSDAAAKSLVEEKFGSRLDHARAGSGLEQLEGDRQVVRFVDEHTVVLAGDKDRPPVLLESPRPLWTETAGPEPPTA
jgi:hypothetical protein